MRRRGGVEFGFALTKFVFEYSLIGKLFRVKYNAKFRHARFENILPVVYIGPETFLNFRKKKKNVDF